jgi:hypothetical protein
MDGITSDRRNLVSPKDLSQHTKELEVNIVTWVDHKWKAWKTFLFLSFLFGVVQKKEMKILLGVGKHNMMNERMFWLLRKEIHVFDIIPTMFAMESFLIDRIIMFIFLLFHNFNSSKDVTRLDSGRYERKVHCQDKVFISFNIFIHTYMLL